MVKQSCIIFTNIVQKNQNEAEKVYGCSEKIKKKIKKKPTLFPKIISKNNFDDPLVHKKQKKIWINTIISGSKMKKKKGFLFVE